MKKKLSLKKIFIVALSLLFVFSIFNVGRVLADTKVFKLLDAKINEKSDNTDASITADEDGIKTDITFHKVNEYVVYKLSLKNQDTKDYTIKSISDDNKDPYVSYVYDKHENEIIKAGETKDILVKVSYDKEVTNVDDREDKEPVKLSFSLVDKEGNEVVDNITIDNPKTNDNISKYIVLSIISLSGIVLLVIKNKKTKKVMLLVLMLTPFIGKAFDSGFELIINNDIKFYDKLVVKLNVNGEEETKTVSYGDKITEPEEPIKNGYNFLGWYNGEEKYDFDSSVKDDITLAPKYETIKYTISFNYNGGIAINPIEYDVETDSITLVNPIKPGYSFSGWTGSNGDTYQTRVTIEKGSIGDLEFTANFSANDDTTYIVRHRYLNLDGETYVEEVEELTGTTDTTVRPQGKHKDGFVDKEDADLENLVITGDGKAELIYVYDRVMLNLSYNEDVESDFAEGQYMYGTQITVDVKDKTGYTFAGWADDYDSNSKLVYFDNNQDGLIDLGDIVFIGNNWFYVIAEPENGQVKLLPKYNISSNNRQSISTNGRSFSNTVYWNGSSDYEPYGSSEYKYVYRNKNGEETNNNLKERINLYKDYLNGLNIVDVLDARLMSYDEAEETGCRNLVDYSCPDFVDNQRYWLGSSDSSSMWLIYDDGSGLAVSNNSSSSYGVRPIIIISSDDIENVYNNPDSLSFFINEDTNVVPFYKPNTNTPYKVVHKQQTVNGDGYTVFETEDNEGTTGYEVTPDVKSYRGFQSPSKQTTTINADGSTEIIYNYSRNQYTLTVNHPEWVVDGNSKSGLYYYQQEISLTAKDRDGYTFTKWSNDNTNKSFVLSMYANNLTIEPQYTRNQYVVTFDPTDGSSITESVSVDAGDELSFPTNPTRNGFTFNGWWTSAEGGEEVSAPYVPTESTTLYAHWEENNNPIAYLTDEDNDLDISLGDKVTIGEDEFYFIGRDEYGNLKLLAKYNLDSNYRQSENDYEYLTFSDTNYWASAGSSSSSSSSSSSGSGSSSSYSFNTDSYGYEYVYRTSDNEDISENNLTNYVNNYKDYITSETEIDVNDARLMSYDEALVTGCDSYANDLCPVCFANQSYWLGSANDNYSVWFVYADDRYLSSFGYNEPYIHGVRPVIIVSESDVSMPWSNNTAVLYSDFDSDSRLSIGDAVRISNELFYVIQDPSDDQVILMAGYNLNDNYRQDLRSEQFYRRFAETAYWENNLGSYIHSTNYVYEVYKTYNGEDTDNLLHYSVNRYKSYLSDLDSIDIIDIRIATYREISNALAQVNQPHFKNQKYWLSTTYQAGDRLWQLYYVQSPYDYYEGGTENTSTWIDVNVAGVRPVIVVKASDIPTNFD